MSSPEKDDKNNRIKVLFVDDEIAFVDVIAKRLSKRNMYVTGTYSGTEALQALRKEDFDIAILDLKMEDIDGIEVLKIFKKMDPKLDVIMLTGHGSEQAARDGIKFGAVDYLTKLCDLEELIRKINEIYKAKR
jgi:DNA-binding response OmpR family regulator